MVKGLFTYLDALVNKQMSSFFLTNMPIDIPNMAPYPDLFSFGVTLVFAGKTSDDYIRDKKRE